MSDILVLGTRGVGKTTLLTVLGYKFAKPGAFGLSLAPCNRETLLHVRAISRQLVLNHRFPAATDASNPVTVSWDVIAGTERQYGLSSLDCGGELVSRVFGEGKTAADPFGETETESFRKARESLSGLAKGAAAVCLVLAPDDLPENRTVRALQDPGQRKRFDEIDDLVHAVTRSPAFEGKRLVVALTQTDDENVRRELASLGGPRGYLRRKCPALASSPRFAGGHAVAVASVVLPVRPDGSEAGPGETEVPENFASSGLEDLLLALGGAVHSDSSSPIASLAEARRALLDAEWQDIQAQLAGDAASRLSSSRRLAAAAERMRRQTSAFLDHISAEPLTRRETSSLLAEEEAMAHRRKAVEEAVAKALADSGTPDFQERLASALESAKSLFHPDKTADGRGIRAGIATVKQMAGDLFRIGKKLVRPDVPTDERKIYARFVSAVQAAILSSDAGARQPVAQCPDIPLSWVMEQRVALRETRRQRKAAVRAAIKEREQPKAREALSAWLDITGNPDSLEARQLRKCVETIKPEPTLAEKASVWKLIAVFIPPAIILFFIIISKDIELILLSLIGFGPGLALASIIETIRKTACNKCKMSGQRRCKSCEQFYLDTE